MYMHLCIWGYRPPPPPSPVNLWLGIKMYTLTLYLIKFLSGLKHRGTDINLFLSIFYIHVDGQNWIALLITALLI